MKAMAVSCKKKKKRLPYNQKDKWRRLVENVLSVTQTSTGKQRLEIFPVVSMDMQGISL
jgi:hypothetical protein